LPLYSKGVASGKQGKRDTLLKSASYVEAVAKSREIAYYFLILSVYLEKLYCRPISVLYSKFYPRHYAR